MEIPRRARGDELLKPGQMTGLRDSLRRLSGKHDLASVIACAFDHRTRMLPFIYADTRMVPAGVRAIGSAMADIGFSKTRIVLQQWNPNFKPSLMRLDGRVPDLFMVSSMQIHTAQCHALLRDAWQIDPANRPLIIAGGPKAIYEPWDVFNSDPNQCWGADVAVTGEEYVLLSLMEVLLSVRAEGESLRSAFRRARDGGMLDGIPGLVYSLGEKDGVAEELVDTGTQRLLRDLDELPHPVLGYRLLEPPSREATLANASLPAGRVRRYSPLASLVLTFGCKFNCPYCPIPAYNQRQHRAKSGARIADEFVRLHQEYGINYFFGTDDNFFNDKQRTLEIVETLVRTWINGTKFRKIFRWATEVTVHDTLQMRDHLSAVRASGMRALWLGVEDMTGALIKKGQSVSGTEEAFRLLSDHGIVPMPMMMHHDGQPLYTRGEPRGLLNQVRRLRRAGAAGLQVLMITPATGSRGYEENFTSGLVYAAAGGRRVEQHMLDGNYVVASSDPRPWRKQLNIMLAYLYFYNPLRFLRAIIQPKTKLYLVDSGMQVLGMWGTLQTIRRTLGWALRLRRGPITRHARPPGPSIPVRRAVASTASPPSPQPASTAVPADRSCVPAPLTKLIRSADSVGS